MVIISTTQIHDSNLTIYHRSRLGALDVIAPKIPISFIHKLTKKSSMTYFQISFSKISLKIKCETLDNPHFPRPSPRCERKRKKASKRFSPHPAAQALFDCQSNQQWLPRLWKTLFLLSWSDNTSIFLQTLQLAENRVSAFLYLMLLPGLELWMSELA